MDLRKSFFFMQKRLNLRIALLNDHFQFVYVVSELLDQIKLGLGRHVDRDDMSPETAQHFFSSGHHHIGFFLKYRVTDLFNALLLLRQQRKVIEGRLKIFVILSSCPFKHIKHIVELLQRSIGV